MVEHLPCQGFSPDIKGGLRVIQGGQWRNQAMQLMPRGCVGLPWTQLVIQPQHLSHSFWVFCRSMQSCTALQQPILFIQSCNVCVTSCPIAKQYGRCCFCLQDFSGFDTCMQPQKKIMHYLSKFAPCASHFICANYTSPTVMLIHVYAYHI